MSTLLLAWSEKYGPLGVVAFVLLYLLWRALRYLRKGEITIIYTNRGSGRKRG